MATVGREAPKKQLLAVAPKILNTRILKHTNFDDTIWLICLLVCLVPNRHMTAVIWKELEIQTELQHCQESSSRWWQLKYWCCFQPEKWGEGIQFDYIIFYKNRGWFNHQLVHDPSPQRFDSCRSHLGASQVISRRLAFWKGIGLGGLLRWSGQYLGTKKSAQRTPSNLVGFSR